MSASPLLASRSEAQSISVGVVVGLPVGVSVGAAVGDSVGACVGNAITSSCLGTRVARSADDGLVLFSNRVRAWDGVFMLDGAFVLEAMLSILDAV